MNVDKEFRDYNWYRRLVRRGIVEPLEHQCGTEYISGYGEGDSFILKCFSCDTTIIPGLDVLDKIHDTVVRHFG